MLEESVGLLLKIICFVVVQKANPEEDKEEEEEEEQHSVEEILRFEEMGYEVIGQAWPSVQETQGM